MLTVIANGVLWMYWFVKWWGLLGGVVAFFLLPLSPAFPFVYLYKEGFSGLIFGIWGLGIVSYAFNRIVDSK